MNSSHARNWATQEKREAGHVDLSHRFAAPSAMPCGVDSKQQIDLTAIQTPTLKCPCISSPGSNRIIIEFSRETQPHGATNNGPPNRRVSTPGHFLIRPGTRNRPTWSCSFECDIYMTRECSSILGRHRFEFFSCFFLFSISILFWLRSRRLMHGSPYFCAGLWITGGHLFKS